jgi:gamma-glutamyltranspeptidase/glutathione hydrolase
MPFRHDIRTVTVPGCIDGWCALHARFGRLPLHQVLAPAIALAEHGFPASPLLVGALAQVDHAGREELAELARQARRPGTRVRRPGAARVLSAVGADGRAGAYQGEFGRGLTARWPHWFTPDDLAAPIARWVQALTVDAWGVRLHTVPPSSQGYLTLGSAALADAAGLPGDPGNAQWAHLLVEAATAAAFDRPEVLYDGADGAALVAAAAGRASMIDHERASLRPGWGRDGDTTYLCTADDDGMAVSLIQSNASGFGSWLVEPSTGINLHNRGLGFSVDDGHPAELRPGHRPPHTLAPLMVTRTDGTLVGPLGTMGGDAQPQILLQLAARLFHHGQTPAEAIHAPRWAMRGPRTGFDTWTVGDVPFVQVEEHGADEWLDGLRQRGHRAAVAPAFDASAFGHAHVIVRDPEGFWVGAADPRARVGSCAGL